MLEGNLTFFPVEGMYKVEGVVFVGQPGSNPHIFISCHSIDSNIPSNWEYLSHLETESIGFMLSIQLRYC